MAKVHYLNKEGRTYCNNNSQGFVTWTTKEFKKVTCKACISKYRLDTGKVDKYESNQWRDRK